MDRSQGREKGRANLHAHASTLLLRVSYKELAPGLAFVQLREGREVLINSIAQRRLATAGLREAVAILYSVSSVWLDRRGQLFAFVHFFWLGARNVSFTQREAQRGLYFCLFLPDPVFGTQLAFRGTSTACWTHHQLPFG